MEIYRTISVPKEPIETLYEIQRSKFITHLTHVEDEAQARAFILAQKKRYYDARHNCFAFILGERGEVQRSSDDGEPGGTAGAPILEAIKKRGLTFTVVVVTRYFGGIKLGAGGLTRAYGHAAALGLDAVSVVEMRPLQSVHATIGYQLYEKVLLWAKNAGLNCSEADFTDAVTLPILMPPEEVEARQKELIDLSSGRIKLKKGEITLASVPV